MKNKIKLNNIVRVVPGTTPVKRIGYPLRFDEVESVKDHPILSQIDSLSTYLKENSQKMIQWALKKSYVEENSFGGNERSVIRQSKDDPTFIELDPDFYYKITKIKRKVIGTYDPEKSILKDAKHISVISITPLNTKEDIEIQILDTDILGVGI